MVAVAVAMTHLGHEQRVEETGNQLKAQSLRTLEMVSAGALESVISEDIAVLDTLISETTALDDDIYSIRITNEVGQHLVSWTRPARFLPAGAYTFSGSIDFEGEKFGTVTAVWDPARLLAEVDKRLAAEQARLIFALLILTVLSLSLLHVLVASPLSKIAARLQMLSDDGAGGEDTKPLQLSSSREMAMLSVAVNDLGNAFANSRKLSVDLEHQANHDHLTGLENRSSFEKRLINRLAERYPGTQDDTLLYFDLDQFKVVNDTCGHAAGDALLRQLSALLISQFRPNDTFARLGGDEFAVLLPAVPVERGLQFAEHLRASVETFRFSWNDHIFAPEASIGAVAISGIQNTIEELMTAADIACYAAKNSGRNRVHLYEVDDAELSQRQTEMNWVPRIRNALETTGLVLYGQIIEPARLNTDDDPHIEVLLRMQDENNDLIPPGAFLPAAERYGLMPHIDRWVISNTLSWMAAHIVRAEKIPVCAINISGASICDDSFREFLLKTLSQTQVPHQNICFEITETVAVANLASAIEFMQMIKLRGCSFALDDFGAGMSSFTYLKNLPVDFVKIDGAFVRDLLNNETSVAMVKAMADISRVMQIKSIAEFVENDDVRNKLMHIGIDFVQGYGVGKPQPLPLFQQQQVTLPRAA